MNLVVDADAVLFEVTSSGRAVGEDAETCVDTFLTARAGEGLATWWRPAGRLRPHAEARGRCRSGEYFGCPPMITS